MPHHNTVNSNVNSLSKLFQISTKYKTLLLRGSGSFSQAKALSLHKKLRLSPKNHRAKTSFFFFLEIATQYFWPAKKRRHVSNPYFNHLLAQSQTYGQRGLQPGGSGGKMGIPWILWALLGCWLLTIFACGRVGERRGQAEGAGHAGAGAVQAAAQVQPPHVPHHRRGVERLLQENSGKEMRMKKNWRQRGCS